ncbi:hypothetical protein B0O99DRAFT_690086 [Bisporella sp. PMI_857]|nr:hypothetical protein B0O99DRAFT_690086 [Bisporella sp. PMI_857]
MDPISLTASIIAVIQISNKVISLTRAWIETVKDAPRELQLIHIEISSLTGILESLSSLSNCGSIQPHSIEKLQGRNGLVEQCQGYLTELEILLSPDDGNGKCWKMDKALIWPLKVLGIRRNMSLDTLRWPLKATKARKLLENIQRVMKLMSFTLLCELKYDHHDTYFGIRRVEGGLSKIRDRLNINFLEDLLQWIAPLNVSYRESFAKFLGQRFGQTGIWLLESTEYQEWIKYGGYFSLQGRSGSGKSVLSAVVIEDLQRRARSLEEPMSCVLYYHFDMRDAAKNTKASLYDSLIRQLLQYDPSGYADVLHLATDIGREHPTSEEYDHLLEKLLQRTATVSTVYLVLDACEPRQCVDFVELKALLKDLVSWSRGKGADKGSISSDEITNKPQFCSEPQKRNGAGGTEEMDIRLFLTSCEVMKLSDHQVSVLLPTPGFLENIETYAQGKVDSMGEAAREAMGEEVKKTVVKTIVDKSDELFVQATLHLEKITNMFTVGEIEDAIRTLPCKIDDTYREILLEILDCHPGDAKDVKDAKCKMFHEMFMWLCQANYCLTVSEFVAMVTVKFTTTGMDKKSVPWDPEGYCQRLGPFLNIHPGTGEINLPHYTIEKYLQDPAIKKDSTLGNLYVSEVESQKALAEKCVRFLRLLDFNKPLSELDEVDGKYSEINHFKCIPGGLGIPLNPDTYKWIGPMQQRLKAFPGLEYSSINWHIHVERAGDQGWVRDGLVEHLDWFLDEKDPRFKSWQEVHAYFCWDSECHCGTWQSPQYFLEKFKLGFLLELVGGPQLEASNLTTTMARLPHNQKQAGPRTQVHCASCDCELSATADHMIEKSNAVNFARPVSFARWSR